MVVDKIETTFYLSDEVLTALKVKAVKEKRRYSDVAEELLRLGLRLEPIVERKEKKVKK